MRELILVRHAKSSWKQPDLADQDRPLSGRGVRDGRLMAEALPGRLPVPDQVLCSPARRTRDTLAFLVPALVDPRRVTFAPEVYEADADTLLEQILGAADAQVLLVLGHNPGLTELVNLLVDRPADRIDNLPTFGVARLAPADDGLPRPGANRRLELIRPKALRSRAFVPPASGG